MTRGACASGDILSAATGRDVLRAGGNAVDAAVAAGLMAAFSLPTMTALGGAGVMTLRVEDREVVCDFFANHPGLGTGSLPRPEPAVVIVDFEDVPQPFYVGPSTIAVPGTVAGLWEVHRRYGHMPIAELASPAIRAARQGVEVTSGQYRAFALLADIFRMTPEAWGLIGDEDGLHQVGDTIRNPALADTLERIVEEGPRAFYEGEVARAVIEASEGFVTHEDLAAYRPVFREPLRASYRGWAVRAPAMPSLTGAMLLISLAHLEAGGPLPRRFDPPAWGRVADALRRAESLRTQEYEERLFEAGFLERVLARCPGGSTMQCSTIDAEGRAVSYTTTVGESAGHVAPGTGVILNNFLGEEDIHPARARRIPGERMMTSMCPSLLCDAAGRWMAVGSAGSARIRSAILQIILQVVDCGATLKEAIGRPRIHAEGDTLYVEGFGRSKADVEALRPYGRDLVATWAAGFFFGGAQAVAETTEGFAAAAETVRRSCAAFVA